MANIKIAQLTNATTISDTDIVLIEDATQTKKMTVANLKSLLGINDLATKIFGGGGTAIYDTPTTLKTTITVANMTDSNYITIAKAMVNSPTINLITGVEAVITAPNTLTITVFGSGFSVSSVAYIRWAAIKVV